VNLKREILAKVHAVPPLPEVVFKLQKYCNDPNVSYSELAKVIEVDPGLTTSLLRLANSAYFGCEGTIGSVQYAMTRLGLKRVYQMVLAVCVAPMTRKPIRGYDLTPAMLWQHAIATAMAAEYLAQELGSAEPADAFTAGMLHDMGKIVLGNFVDVDMARIRQLMEERNIPFDEAERETFGTDHAAVAASLLQRWQIPARIVTAVRFHHHPSGCSDPEPLLDIVHIADVLCRDVGWGMGADALQYRFDPTSAERLALPPDIAEQTMAEVSLGLEGMMEIFRSLGAAGGQPRVQPVG
jgi:putative nucleotidyltransferase with HDIG domain